MGGPTPHFDRHWAEVESREDIHHLMLQMELVGITVSDHKINIGLRANKERTPIFFEINKLDLNLLKKYVTEHSEIEQRESLLEQIKRLEELEKNSQIKLPSR